MRQQLISVFIIFRIYFYEITLFTFFFFFLNLGVSCRLIPSDSQQKVVFSEHIDPVTVQIQQKLQEIEEVKDSTFSLIIDGKALSEVLGKSDIDLNENAKVTFF